MGDEAIPAAYVAQRFADEIIQGLGATDGNGRLQLTSDEANDLGKWQNCALG